MKTPLLRLSLFVFISLVGLGQLAAQTAPPSNLSGQSLRTWLKSNWYDSYHNTLGYNTARSAMYSYIDSEGGTVYCVYTGYSQAAANTTYLNPINAEHTVPQSWFNSSEPMRSDIHHLYPTHGSVNSARSNYPFNEINDASTDTWYGLSGSNYTTSGNIPSSGIDSWSERNGSVFEPREDHKGNLARAIFYFYTMYPTQAGNISDIISNGDINVLYQWHLDDPVDATEITRNNRTEERQGNRNPYIDYPNIVADAWGFTPSSGTPPATPSLALSSGTNSMSLSWSNVANETGYKVFRSTNNSTYTQLTTLSANVTSYTDNAVSAGTTYYYYVMAFNGDGDSNASTIRSGSPSGSTGGGGGGDATELFLSEYIEGSSNNKALEIANFTGSSVNLSSYSIRKQANGAGSWGSELSLSGNLANGDVYVIANSSANSTITAQADVTTGSGAVTFNGNDPVGLFKNGTLIDVIGNFNGGSTNFAQNQTLVRKSTVTSPSTSYVTSQWTVNAQDDASDLGSHTMDGGGTTPDPCDAPTGLASSSVTTNSFVVSWSGVTGAASYEVRVGSSVVGTTSSTSYTITGLSASTTYTVSVRTSCASTTSAYSNSLNVTTGTPAPSLSCSSTISSFPYSESFESGLGAWSQGSGDDNDWTRDSGGTPSSGTGPSAGSVGSWYMYLETSGNGTGYPNKTAYLNSPCYNLASASSASFSFDYHMNGNNVGSLQLEATTDGTNWTSVETISGSQGTAWQTATVNLASYTGSTVKFRFLATSGSGWSSDIAVDNIELNTGATGGGGGGASTSEVTLTLVTDNYGSETTWSLTNSSGTAVASGTGYGNNQTITETFTLADGCYDFTINDSYGDGICCSFGNGSYLLTKGGTTLASGGSFGSTETKNFCVDGASRTTAGEVVAALGKQDLTLRVYPNPATSVLNLQTNAGVSQVVIYNAMGQLVQEATVSKAANQLDISKLKEGIYILKLKTASGESTQRFVKK